MKNLLSENRLGAVLVIALILVSTPVVSAPAEKQEYVPSYISTADLYTYCSAVEFHGTRAGVRGNSTEAGTCMGFIEGVAASSSSKDRVCWRGDGDVPTVGQLVIGTLQYIETHSDAKGKGAGFVVREALRKNYPCAAE